MNKIIPMTSTAIKKVYALEDIILKMPQVDIEIDHVFHAGMYARTVMIPAGVVLTGALIKIPTLLIVQGNVIVYIGGESKEFIGYHVIQGGANRKQAFFAKEDTMLTMIFPTNAATIDEAENEFTNEVNMLINRKNKGV